MIYILNWYFYRPSLRVLTATSLKISLKRRSLCQVLYTENTSVLCHINPLPVALFFFSFKESRVRVHNPSSPFATWNPWLKILFSELSIFYSDRRRWRKRKRPHKATKPLQSSCRWKMTAFLGISPGWALFRELHQVNRNLTGVLKFALTLTDTHSSFSNVKSSIYWPRWGPDSQRVSISWDPGNMTEKRAQSMKCLLHKQQDPSLYPQHPH